MISAGNVRPVRWRRKPQEVHVNDDQRGWRPEDVGRYDDPQRPESYAWHQTGEVVDIDLSAVQRIPEYDPARRDHLWTWALLFRMIPGVKVPRMDNENLLLVVPAACFYCEQLYDVKITRGLCTGPAYPRTI